MFSNLVPTAIKKYSSVVMKRAVGCYVYDIHNSRYLDFCSGIGVMNLGHSHKGVNKAIKKQINLYTHAQQMCLYDPNISKVTELLTSLVPNELNMCFYCPSGSEAVDNAIKISRFHTNKQKIISLDKAFHGRSLGILGLTNSLTFDRYRLGAPLANCIYINRNLILDKIEEDSDIAAIIVEPIQGEGGVHKIDIDFLKDLRYMCDMHNILMIVDEIQCGIGRSGNLFAYEDSSIIPDMILTGKALANGLPLAGIISRKEIFDSCPIGGLGGTFGGNAVALAAAHKVLNILKHTDLLHKVKDKSEYIKILLHNLKLRNKCIKEVRVYGLMIGIEFDYEVKPLLEMCEKNGLLLLPTNNKYTLRMLPPLIVKDHELEEAVNILENAIIAKELNILQSLFI